MKLYCYPCKMTHDLELGSVERVIYMHRTGRRFLMAWCLEDLVDLSTKDDYAKFVNDCIKKRGRLTSART